jgi:hypothetical protein
MFDFSRPELRVWANSDSEMQRFESCRPVSSLWAISGSKFVATCPRVREKLPSLFGAFPGPRMVTRKTGTASGGGERNSAVFAVFLACSWRAVVFSAAPHVTHCSKPSAPNRRVDAEANGIDVPLKAQ